MPKPAMTDSEVERQRERLASKAWMLYRNEGLETVSFRRLAQETQVSPMAIYRYFKSKDELLAYMRAQLVREFQDELETAVLHHDDALETLCTLVRAMFAFALRRPADYRFTFAMDQPAVSQFPELNSARVSLLNWTRGLCGDAIRAGLLDGDEITRAHMIWGVVHGFVSLDSANQLAHGRSLKTLEESVLTMLFPRMRTRVAVRAEGRRG